MFVRIHLPKNILFGFFANKKFWQLSRSGDFAVGRNANLFVLEKLRKLLCRTVVHLFIEENFCEQKNHQIRGMNFRKYLLKLRFL